MVQRKCHPYNPKGVGWASSCISFLKAFNFLSNDSLIYCFLREMAFEIYRKNDNLPELR